MWLHRESWRGAKPLQTHEEWAPPLQPTGAFCYSLPCKPHHPGVEYCTGLLGCPWGGFARPYACKTYWTLYTKFSGERKPLPRQLLTLYYTTLKIIYITHVIAHAVSHLTELGKRIGGIQGIHDGTLFVSDALEGKEQQALVNSVNERLETLTLSTLDVPVLVDGSLYEAGDFWIRKE